LLDELKLLLLLGRQLLLLRSLRRIGWCGCCRRCGLHLGGLLSLGSRFRLLGLGRSRSRSQPQCRRARHARPRRSLSEHWRSDNREHEREESNRSHHLFVPKVKNRAGEERERRSPQAQVIASGRRSKVSRLTEYWLSRSRGSGSAPFGRGTHARAASVLRFLASLAGLLARFFPLAIALAALATFALAG